MKTEKEKQQKIIKEKELNSKDNIENYSSGNINEKIVNETIFEKQETEKKSAIMYSLWQSMQKNNKTVQPKGLFIIYD